MKILLTAFEICDYGGIVNHVEYLAKGFRELGHQVEFSILRDSGIPLYRKKLSETKGCYPSYTGGQCHTTNGWYGVDVRGYGSPGGMRGWQDFANRFDLVIHEIPAPKPDAEGKWQGIYDIAPTQVIAAHDCHFREFYPHLALVANRIKAITCTQHAGYVALEWCPIPRAFIGAPHELLDWNSIPPWGQRERVAVSAHVWKAWKQMHKVVECAPMLRESAIVLGGDGIEGRYMRSKDKVKPKYAGLWDKYLASGNTYRGMMTHAELYSQYQASRVMVDMSFNRKFASMGNHFNRSAIESYNNGVLPICTRENMHEHSPQVSLFEDGKTHIPVDADIEPSRLAEVIDWAANLPESQTLHMIERGRKILSDHFDYRVSCREYLKLAKGEPAGIYPKLETGVMPDGVVSNFLSNIPA
jgi:glycosyltransferase involved in cell wall biosynthesis